MDSSEYGEMNDNKISTHSNNKRRKNVGKRGGGKAAIKNGGKYLKTCQTSAAVKLQRPHSAIGVYNTRIGRKTSTTTRIMDISDVPSTTFSGNFMPRSLSCLPSIRRRRNGPHNWSGLPVEILMRIFNLMVVPCRKHRSDLKTEQDERNCATILAARCVCRAWNRVVLNSNTLLNCFAPITVNRFTIGYDAKARAYEFRWCNYNERNSRKFTLPYEEIRQMYSMQIPFSRFDICRIVFQDLKRDTLNDELVRFMCAQFAYCRNFQPKHLILKNASMSALSNKGLHALIEFCAKSLETFEVNKVCGLRPDSITDTHLSELNISKLRRFTIENARFKNHSKKPISLLQISDKTLEKFARCGHFPSLVLERCKVTVNGVVQYMEKWLIKDVATVDQILVDVGSHMFTLRECPAVSDFTFRRECRRRSLDFEEDENRTPADAEHCDGGGAGSANSSSVPCCSRRGSAESDIISYNIFRMKSVKEFLVTLSSSCDEHDNDYCDNAN